VLDSIYTIADGRRLGDDGTENWDEPPTLEIVQLYVIVDRYDIPQLSELAYKMFKLDCEHKASVCVSPLVDGLDEMFRAFKEVYTCLGNHGSGKRLREVVLEVIMSLFFD
jgi:hypothetical protein